MLDAIFQTWWGKTAAYALLASVGGFLGHIMRALDRSDRISWLRAMIESLAAGFVGILVTLACNALSLNDQWTGLIVGVCGWLGANASIRILEKVAFKKLGVGSDVTNDQTSQ